MGAQMSDAMRDDIVMLLKSGIPTGKVAGITKKSKSAIRIVRRCYDAAHSGDVETLRKLAPKSTVAVMWACNSAGLNFDTVVLETAPVEEASTAVEPTPPVERTTDNTAQAFVAVLDAVIEQTEAVKALASSINGIDSRLSQLQMTVKGFRDETAEQAKKLVEAINVNGDIITREHDKMVDLLGAVKMNTKKLRGGRDD